MSRKKESAPNWVHYGGTMSPRIAPESAHNRSRNPVTRSHKSVRGRFPSLKMGRMIEWESLLERRACFLFEFSPLIRAYREQPDPIWIVIDNKFSKYTADFELELQDGRRIIVEVKPYKDLTREDVSTRMKLATMDFLENDKQLVVMTDRELKKPILEKNLKLLKNHASYSLDPEIVPSAQEWIHTTSHPTIEGLVQHIGSLGAVYALISTHLISADLNQPLQCSSLLQNIKENQHEICIISVRTAPDFKLSCL